MSVKTKNQSTKLSNVVVLDSKTLEAIANGEKKFDNRKNNTGRPVNRTSARQLRLAQQSYYETLNAKFDVLGSGTKNIIRMIYHKNK